MARKTKKKIKSELKEYDCEVGFYRTVKAKNLTDAKSKARKMRLSGPAGRYIVCKKRRK